MMLATVVEWDNVVQVIWASLAAGVGVTLAFSLAIIGATRAVDLRRGGNTAAAYVYVALLVVGLAVTAAAIVLGIVVMTSKG